MMVKLVSGSCAGREQFMTTRLTAIIAAAVIVSSGELIAIKCVSNMRTQL